MIILFILSNGTGIAQSVHGRAISWTTGVGIPVGQEIVLLSTASRQTLWPIQPPIQWVSGGCFPGVKLTGREVDHSPPSCAQVNNGGVVPALPYTSSRRGA
jgi:hypothetical protein